MHSWPSFLSPVSCYLGIRKYSWEKFCWTVNERGRESVEVNGVGPDDLTNLELMSPLPVCLSHLLLVSDSLLYGELPCWNDPVRILHWLQKQPLMDPSLSMLGDGCETFWYGESSVWFSHLWGTQQAPEIYISYVNYSILNETLTWLSQNWLDPSSTNFQLGTHSLIV